MIPRQLHAFWGGPPMPDHLARNLDAWRDMHPGWDLTLWTPDAVPELRHQRYYDHPERYSPKSNVWQYRTNILRYELLHDLGGWWIDCDLEPRRPIDELRRHRLVAAWELQCRHINNALIGAEPGHPALKTIIDGIPASIKRQPRRRSTWQTGGHYITPILRDRVDVTILDQRLVYPYAWNELHRAGEPFPDAYAVHHWHNARTNAGA